MKQFIGNNNLCPITKITVGCADCLHHCLSFKKASTYYIYCKPPLGLRVMSLFSGFKTDKFRRDLLIWLFGFCSGGVFMTYLAYGFFK